MSQYQSLHGESSVKVKKKIKIKLLYLCLQYLPLFPKNPFSHQHKLISISNWGALKNRPYYQALLFPLLSALLTPRTCKSRNPEIFYKTFVFKNNPNYVYLLHREGHYLPKQWFAPKLESKFVWSSVSQGQ